MSNVAILIRPQDLKRSGKVDLWDLGPAKDAPGREAWEADNGGPVRIERFAVDARHALTVEPKRYMLRLPKGMEPGRAQREADEAAAEEREAAEQSDPHYGRKS